MNPADRPRLFKKLTPENWREHDGTADPIVRYSTDGTHKISEDEWAACFLETQLSEQLPEDVRYLFEAAQGVMCYGCYFYPLYALGSEQLYRVLEAALHHKCVQLEAPKEGKTFKEMLDWLRGRGALSERQLARWEAGRNLRNIASHADRQSLHSPDMAVGNICITAELINELFA